MNASRRLIASTLVALAAIGGVSATAAQPAEAAPYRTGVGGPWASFADCNNYLNIAIANHPGAYGRCAQTTYMGISGIFGVINIPLRPKN